MASSPSRKQPTRAHDANPLTIDHLEAMVLSPPKDPLPACRDPLLSRPAVAARASSEIFARQSFIEHMRKRCIVHVGGGVPELGADLVRTVASEGGARACLVMEQVCKAWQVALRDDEKQALWQMFVNVRFPRVDKVLREFRMPAHSWRQLYKDQTQLDGPLPPAALVVPTCKLSEFVFSVELVQAPLPFTAPEVLSASEKILQSWTGTLNNSGALNASFAVPLPWREWDAQWESCTNWSCNNLPPICLRVHVSRLHRGQLKTFRIFTSQTRPDDAGVGYAYFCGDSLLDMRPADLFDDNVHPELGLTCAVEAGIYLDFKLYDAHDDIIEMTAIQFLHYLEKCIPW